jgi:Flp pilus assembly protein protease CpaA
VEQDAGPDLAARATQLARDALYVTVGAGVLTFARLQVRRRELQAALQRARHDAQPVK